MRCPSSTRTSATGSSSRSRRAAAASAAAAAIVRPPWPSLGRARGAPGRARRPCRRRAGRVVAVELCYLLALALVTPPNDIDALTYHLMRGALWIQQEAVAPVGGIADTRIDEFQPDAEILQAATMLLSGSARFAQLVALAAPRRLDARDLRPRSPNRARSTRSGVRCACSSRRCRSSPSRRRRAMTDIVVAGLVAAAAFFLLGRSPGELGLGVPDRRPPGRHEGHGAPLATAAPRDRPAHPSRPEARARACRRRGRLPRRRRLVRRQPARGRGGIRHGRARSERHRRRRRVDDRARHALRDPDASSSRGRRGETCSSTSSPPWASRSSGSSSRGRSSP